MFERTRVDRHNNASLNILKRVLSGLDSSASRMLTGGPHLVLGFARLQSYRLYKLSRGYVLREGIVVSVK